MRKEKRVICGADLMVSLILAGELAVLADTVSVFFGRALSVPKFGLLLAALFLAVWLIPAVTRKVRNTAVLILTAGAGLLLAGGICWYSVSQSVVYSAVDHGKEQLYAGRKVMLLVPHQDDDINVLGGVMEEYVKYGSDVYVVFSTNGDYYDLAEVRIQEAVNALGNIGIPEDHVIFLGYGDQWEPGGPHIYNGGFGTVLQSYIGYNQTYGTENHPSYRVGKDYTTDHFLEDIESVILEYRPDVLYCVDYDYNIDHRALSMSFEKVMGKILKEEPDYAPLVFKGYAYNTAWEAENDFYGENLLSAQNVFTAPYDQQPEVYRWEDRVRLPVNGETLSRSVISAQQNVTLSMYESQGANMYGPRIFNSDKVFWQRRTDSLCHQAQIRVSSGSGHVLNDFMLLESFDLLEEGDTPFDGAWTPAGTDAERQVTVIFPEPKDIDSIVLYDNPDPRKNVKNAAITFDDGVSIETGPLDPNGAASCVAVEKRLVSSFVVMLTETEGEAGLTELEAYDTSLKFDMPYVKLMDEEENFVYDYWIEEDGVQTFRLYTAGGAPAEAEQYTLLCDNAFCDAVWENGSIQVRCPEGEQCTVTVRSADGNLADSVHIQNPGKLERGWKMFWLRAEETVMNLCENKRLHERLFVCRLLEKMAG